MPTKGVPQGAEFAFDSAIRSLDDQLSRIDALDAKAGILLVADGILAGLIFGRDAFVRRAQWVIALAAGARRGRPVRHVETHRTSKYPCGIP